MKNILVSVVNDRDLYFQFYEEEIRFWKITNIPTHNYSQAYAALTLTRESIKDNLIALFTLFPEGI